MTNDNSEDLRRQCASIAESIETGVFEFSSSEDNQELSACDWLEDALDIQYLVNSDGSYRHARILVAFGGPNIWVDTRTRTVEGRWWGNSVDVGYYRDALDLDGALEELWSCR